MIQQKILTIGNSLGVTFPREFVEKNGIKPGGSVAITHSNGSITYTTNLPKETVYDEIPDEEFFKLVKEVDFKYKDALDELANLS